MSTTTTATTTESFAFPVLAPAEKAVTLALRLAHAEHALNLLTAGQADAIIDPDGRTYLLRPAQEQLRERERRLQALIESLPEAIAIVNRAGAMLSQSGAAKSVLGVEPAELVGQNIFQFVHPEDLPLTHAAFTRVREGLLDHLTTEFRFHLPDGSWRLLEAAIGKLRDASGDHCVFSLRPVREYGGSVRRQSALALAALAKDRFLAMLSHELRTPLAPVLLGLQELEQDEQLAPVRPTLEMMRRNLEVEMRLLGDLLDFSRISHEKVRLERELIDAHEAVRFVLAICGGEIAAARLGVTLELQATDFTIRADSVRLQQVMWNVVKNAVHYSPPGSRLFIRSNNSEAGTLTLEFTDYGAGIEPDLLPLVFDAFQQDDGETPSLQEGLGLGLFIAKGLAEAQQGSLTVTSPGRGQGTTFHLHFPTAASGKEARR